MLIILSNGIVPSRRIYVVSSNRVKIRLPPPVTSLSQLSLQVTYFQGNLSRVSWLLSGFLITLMDAVVCAESYAIGLLVSLYILSDEERGARKLCERRTWFTLDD